jgi:hypothetical protein
MKMSTNQLPWLNPLWLPETSRKKTVAVTIDKLIAAQPKVARIEAIDARLADITHEMSRTRGRLPKAEVAARLVEVLKSRREAFVDGRAPYLDAQHLVGALSADGRIESPFQHVVEIIDVLVWLMGDDLDRRVKRAVDALSYNEGLGSAERKELKARLDQEHASLIAERANLVDELAALGVTVKHHPITGQQRNAEQRAAKDLGPKPMASAPSEPMVYPPETTDDRPSRTVVREIKKDVMPASNVAKPDFSRA